MNARDLNETVGNRLAQMWHDIRNHPRADLGEMRDVLADFPGDAPDRHFQELLEVVVREQQGKGELDRIFPETEDLRVARAFGRYLAGTELVNEAGFARARDAVVRLYQEVGLSCLSGKAQITVASALDGQPRAKPDAFVCSPNPAWANAVSKTLSLVMTHSARPLGIIEPDTVAAELQAVHALHEDLPCVVHFPGRSEAVAERCARWIIHMRCDPNFWMGGLVAIVDNRSCAEAIKQVDIRCDRDATKSTFKVFPSAHRCVVGPVNLADLCLAVHEFRRPQLTANEWRAYCKSGPLFQLETLAKELLGCQDLASARSCWSRIKEAWDRVCWCVFHPHGETLALIDEISSAKPETLPELRAAATKILLVLKRILGQGGD